MRHAAHQVRILHCLSGHNCCSGACCTRGRAAAHAAGSPTIYATGDDLAFVINAGPIDCGIVSRAVAAARRLALVPLHTERFDLAMRRPAYFEPGPQALLATMRIEDLRSHADLLGGLDVGDAGSVRLIAEALAACRRAWPQR